MTIRTPNPINSSQMLLDLQRSKERYSNYASQLTTGKAIVNLGDDPAGSAAILNFQASIDQNSQFISQINAATGFLQNSETVASSVQTQVTRLMELAQSGLNGTQSATSRGAIASEVDGIYTGLVNLANTKVQGKYIFAGTNTTTVPFDAATAPAGQPNSITYNGNNANIDFTVGASATTATNIPGDTLFLGGAAPGSYGGNLDLFNAAKSLSVALNSGNTANIQTAYTNLQAISTHLNDVITQLGGLQNGIDNIKTSLQDVNTNLQAVQDTVEGVDYPTAITGFSREGTAQSATLSVLSKISSKNLFDYLA
ncbi:flagellar hook-associated protein FlgL [Mesoterricola silvestris]|uniref:Flagellar hook-filament junction protein FlgL n=1 Tax=Mesoterricola silvestris TaxID=2927979 RepID=A0AA48GLA1_9BACT|nr:flagellar hook-associated protein FlgL [Mesoterricola silvestris]BDU73344.1 flagellar hook-filament junction protein FlgL [Mesoterricola silvestris]